MSFTEVAILEENCPSNPRCIETMPLSGVLETKKTLNCAPSDHLCLRASQEFSRAADFPH